MESLNSIIEQTLSKSFFEVIVIKNFNNSEVEGLIKSHGFRSILVEYPLPAPEMLSVAIEQANNEIISFLEDDDLFDRGKLERTYKLFNENPSLLFHHSGVKIFTDGDTRHFKGKQKLRPEKPLYIEGPDYDSRLLYYDAAFNISSMSILRHAIDLHHLKTLLTNQDMFMLFSALKTGKTILIDSEIHTYYRVHDNNVSVNLSYEKRVKFNEKHSKTYFQIFDMIKGFRSLQNYLNMYMVGALLEFDLRNRKRSRVMFKDIPIMVCLKLPYAIRRDPGQVPKILAGVISATLRSLFPKFFNTPIALKLTGGT